MLRDSVETSNKYFKVLYGPLDHVFYITLHNRPYKNFVLFDDNFRQIRKIDVDHVSSFQTRCIHSESTINVRNRKQKTITTKYLLEIYFGTTNRNPLTFTTVSFKDSQVLCDEIEKTFGVRVYSYGSLNAAFKNALKNVDDKELLTQTHETFVNRLEKYQLHKDAHDLSHLIQLAHLDEGDHVEPEAEATSKYPVVIEGNMEDGSFVCYRDVRNKNLASTSVYKVEWYLSKSVGTNDEFFEIPSDSSDTFYLTEYMIGHFVMVKVYRAVKFNENRTFLYSTAIRGPVYPNNLLCHHILLNSSRKSDFHDGLMTTLDLDVLFSVVEPRNKFGKYQPFHQPDVLNNFQYFQNYLNTVKITEPKNEGPKQQKNMKNKSNEVLKQSKNEVSTDSETEDEEKEDDNENKKEENNNNSKNPFNNQVLNEKKVKSKEHGYDNDNNINGKEEGKDEKEKKENLDNKKEEDDYLSKMGEGVFEEVKEESKNNTYNKIKLKLPSMKLNSKDLGDDDDDEEGQELENFDYNSMSEEEKANWDFLKGPGNTGTKDLHEVATVSDLSESDQVKTFDVDEYFREQPKKKRFSIFNLFRSDPNKKQKKLKEEGKTKKEVRFDKKNIKNNKNDKRKCFYSRKQNSDKKPLLEKKDKNEDKVEQSEESEELEMQIEHELRMNVVNEESKETKGGKKKAKEDKKKKEKPPKPKKMIMNRRNYKKLQEQRAKMNLESETEIETPSPIPMSTPTSREFSEVEQSEPEEAQVEEEAVESPQVKDETELPKKGLPRKNKNKEHKSDKNKMSSPKNIPKENKMPKSPKNRRPQQNQNNPKKPEMRHGKIKGKEKESTPRRMKGKPKGPKEPVPSPQNQQKLKGPVEKRKKGPGFGLFKKGPHPKGKQVTPPHNPNNELPVKKDEQKETLEKFLAYASTIQNVPVKIKICLNELVITFGIASLNLKWRMISLEKEDQLELDQFPSMKKQLETTLTIVYKCDMPIRIKIRTTSTFQRNVIYHSIIFNKYRNNYSLDRCDRELQSGYYNGVKTAYTKVCRAIYEARKRNQEQTEQQNSVPECQYKLIQVNG